MHEDSETSPGAGWFFVVLGVVALVVAFVPGLAEQVADWAGESGCGSNNEGAGECSTGMVQFFGIVVGVICLLGGGIAIARGAVRGGGLGALSPVSATTLKTSAATITTPEGTRQVDPASLDALMDQMSALARTGSTPSGDAMHRLTQSIFDAAAATPAGAPAAGGDPVERLRKLADLRDAGVVDQAEFERLKRSILGEL